MSQSRNRTVVRLEDLNVMVVDGNSAMRMLVKSMLYAMGFRHLNEASDGEQALQELKFNPADLILTGWSMSPIDGIEFTKTLRRARNSPCPRADIIMLTAHTRRKNVIEARNAGITEFLAKPISPTMLYTRIMSVLKYPRPIIRAGDYTGPDRRRTFPGGFEGGERRKSDEFVIDD